MRSSRGCGTRPWRAPRAKSPTCRRSSTAKGGKFKLAPWDWWYYAEKVRQEKYALDDAALRPYFKLENVRQGIFTLCDKLYGLKFTERQDIPVYNPEVQVFEVREADGRYVGVLYLDFHPRPSKRGGAWSGSFRREYYENGKRVAPLSTITCNFTRPTADAPSLLSIDEAKTFAHEFGHSLATLLAERHVPRPLRSPGCGRTPLADHGKLDAGAGAAHHSTPSITRPAPSSRPTSSRSSRTAASSTRDSKPWSIWRLRFST